MSFTCVVPLPWQAVNLEAIKVNQRAAMHSGAFGFCLTTGSYVRDKVRLSFLHEDGS